MAVPVQDDINAGRALNNGLKVIRRACFLVSDMRHEDNVIRSFTAYFIHVFLNCFNECTAVSVFHKSIDIVSVFIHEVFRIRGNQCFRCCDTDKGNLFSGSLLNDVRLKQKLPAFIEVAADVRMLCLFRQFQKSIHTEIKFMISGNHHVIIQVIHDRDDRFSFCKGSEGISLDRIAVIHKECFDSFFLERLTDLLESDHTESLLKSAVNITGEQHFNIAGLFSFRLRGFLRRGFGLGRCTCGRFFRLLCRCRTSAKHQRKSGKRAKHAVFSVNCFHRKPSCRSCMNLREDLLPVWICCLWNRPLHTAMSVCRCSEDGRLLHALRDSMKYRSASSCC